MSFDFTPVASFFFATLTTAQSATVPATVVAALGLGSKVKVRAWSVGNDSIIDFTDTAVTTITSNVVLAGGTLVPAVQPFEATMPLPTTISVISRSGTVTGLTIQLGV